MSDLPNAKNWRFDEIHAVDPERASRLENAGPPDELVAVLADALAESLNSKTVRFGVEQHSERSDDCRIVIQFWIGAHLFDWCFNARTGYRAHFRASPDCGLAFNHKIIGSFREKLSHFSEERFAPLLDDDFKIISKTNLNSDFTYMSLENNLSKITTCSKYLSNAGVKYWGTPYGAGKIVLGDGIYWPEFDNSDRYAWLDVKGAFLGPAGPYAGRNPMERAIELHKNGRI